MRISIKLAAAAAVALLAAPAAEAHPLAFHGMGFAAGAAHPFMGLDHLLAMLAVGVWAVQQGGRAIWAVPAAFVTMLVAGGAMAMAGIPLPGVEAGILASVVALGLLVAGAARLPMPAGLGLVALTALFHGHAHGAEMPLAASPVGYAVGFTFATIVLHLAGVALGTLGRASLLESRLVRLGGAAMAATGVALLAGA
jgi:urease accessory protein